MNIADSHLQFWKKLSEVARDTYLDSPYRVPSLVFEDIMFGGA